MRRRLLLISLVTGATIWLLARVLANALAAPSRGDSDPIFFTIGPPTPTVCPGCPTPTPTPPPVGTGFTYQGRLQQSGAPVNGTCDLQFRLYDAESNGLQVGATQTETGVQVSNGVFTVTLNDGGQFGADALTGEARWLAIGVRCPAGSGGYTALSPRQPLTGAPFALGLRPKTIVEGRDGFEPILKAVNNGAATGLRGEGGSSGVYGKSRDWGSVGVRGEGGWTGVYGETQNLWGNGVMGVAHDGFMAWGVYGKSNEGAGVVGISHEGSGVIGMHQATAATPGATPQPAVEGRTDSGSAYAAGVLGRVYDTSPGAFSAGVRGINAGTGGAGIGVWGSQGGSGWGVYGESVGGRGVYGLSTGTDGKGVVGIANNGANAYGVWGLSSDGYAGYFSGNVRVNGTLSKSAGSFEIDHPLDPANKTLSHSFVESPDMKNVYDGVVALDAQGEAWVQLPDWFEALNRDFRYQLTCVGGYAPVYIAEEVKGNRFKIAGGKPGLKVSWQVTGIRQDPYAEAHRIPVEQDKPAAERGFYLHPDLYGQPASKSVDAARQPEAQQPDSEPGSVKPPTQSAGPQP